MRTLADLFEAGSPIPAYLQEVAHVHRGVLGDKLVALYLHGSVAQGDFRPGRSDLDILGVVSGGIGSAKAKALVARLNHEALPVPAFGLELILCGVEAVKDPPVEAPYEFALSTGTDWGVMVEENGTTSDILIHMQLCRQAGVALVGPPPAEILATILPNTLRAGLMGEMLWHRAELRHNPSDLAIVNAVLNAARSLSAVATGKIISKTMGGRWWLKLHPEERVVATALAFREGRGASAPDARSALSFLERAIAQL